jgi:electron transport complex protein RnfG
MKRIFGLGLILMLFCVISAALLSWVYLLTKPQIELYARETFNNSLREVLPGAETFKETNKDGQIVYHGLSNGTVIGTAFSLAPQGYGGKIKILVGVDKNGKVSGIKILSQNETPGLGANILKPDFLSQFLGKTIKDPIEPKKDIDAITGATISSRAVCRGVKKALEFDQAGQK